MGIGGTGALGTTVGHCWVLLGTEWYCGIIEIHGTEQYWSVACSTPCTACTP